MINIRNAFGAEILCSALLLLVMLRTICTTSGISPLRVRGSADGAGLRIGNHHHSNRPHRAIRMAAHSVVRKCRSARTAILASFIERGLTMPCQSYRWASRKTNMKPEPAHHREASRGATTTQTPKSNVLTLEEAAALLKCCSATIKRRANVLHIPHKRIGSLWRFYRPDLEAWMRQDVAWVGNTQERRWFIPSPFCVYATSSACLRVSAAWLPCCEPCACRRSESCHGLRSC